jgi:hypothetical protein
VRVGAVGTVDSNVSIQCQLLFHEEKLNLFIGRASKSSIDWGNLIFLRKNWKCMIEKKLIGQEQADGDEYRNLEGKKANHKPLDYTRYNGIDATVKNPK